MNRLDRRVCVRFKRSVSILRTVQKHAIGRLTRVQSLLAKLAADSGLLVAAGSRMV
jgi:hypothetical protein